MRLVAALGPAFAPHGLRITRWWGGLSLRERRLLAVLGVLLALFVVVTLIVRPLQATRGQALADIRTYRTLATRIRAAGPAFAAPPGAARRTGDPAAIVAASAPVFALTPAAVEAAGDAVRVRFGGVPYDALVRWLADLAATSDLRVRRLTLARGRGPGLVDASVEIGR